MKDLKVETFLFLVKFLLVCLLIWLVTSASGCAPTGPQPIPHPVLGKSIMLIPEGTRIGDTITSEEGIYIGKSRVVGIQIRPKAKPKPKQKQKST